MRAVAYRVTRLLRGQWRATLALALAVAAVAGVVLAFAAGARRTATTPDRYTAAWPGPLADVQVEQEAGPPRTAEIAALPGAASVHGITFVFGGLDRAGGPKPPDGLVFAGDSEAFGARLVAGRLPRPAHPEEFVVTRSFAVHGIGPGDRFRLRTLTQEQADRAGFDAAAEGMQGPALDAVLVGVVDGPHQLDDPTPLAAFPPSLLGQGDVGVAASFMTVGLRAGTDRGSFRAQLDTLPGGAGLHLIGAPLVSADLRTAVDGQATALWLVTAVAAAAAVVVLGQLLTRSVRQSADEAPGLQALGYDRRQVLAESAGRAAVPVVVGAALAAVLASAASGAFPAGFVRRIEPYPGVRPDWPLLLAGAAALAAVLIGWTVLVLLLARRVPAPRPPSALVEWAAARARSAPLATGLRFASTTTRRDRGSVRAAVVGMVAAVSLLTGSVVFGVSLGRLVTDGSRFGTNGDLYYGTGGDAVPDDVRAKLAGDRDVAGLMLYAVGQVRVGGFTLQLAGLDPVKGDLAPVVLSGRLPADDDEVALGRLAARTLHARVGSVLPAEGAAGARRLRVTGIAVVPSVEGLDGVGQDAVVTKRGMASVDPDARESVAAVRLRRGAPADTRDRLGPLQENSVPSVIINLARLRPVPWVLAGLVAALAVLTVVHLLATSLRNRRRDVALLRSFGAEGSWLTRAVHWQATSFVVVPLLLGVPLGVVAGRVVFEAFAGRVGAVPDPVFPFALLGAVLAALVAVANVVATGPARAARRLAPAPLLGTE
ncbi:MAG TPA: FtsX-like permease family protein [Acidimicrobiales bacterium]|nr:FtsX-like permease family protein [Acidimicrobiales bacterium]